MPAGRVTFVFTDIEGSTQLFARLGRRFLDLLEEHRRIVRDAVALRGGAEVKTEGDGFFLAFGDAASAIEACIAIQDGLRSHPWNAGEEIRVRIGAHIGDAEPVEGDYYVFAVHEAARIAASGHGGQIVVSEDLRHAAEPIATFVDLGVHELKDLPPMRLFQVGAESFPALRAVSGTRGYVPTPASSLIGRSDELATLVDLIERERLVTITGSGGVGKTRIAVQAANARLGKHADGVWFVDLAPTSDPSSVDETIIDALGIVRDVAVDARTQLKTYLRSHDALIVLDNCEHLIDACSSVANDLLRHCERVRILATSREALGVDGEVPWRLPSLDVSSAVELFEARARLVQPELVSDREVVTKLVGRLDGIPLAIELAAARCQVLSPQQILERLDDRFRLLTGGSRTALARQRTLEATVDWSYNLLDDDERSLLRHVSVFVGGFDLDAAAAVWGDDPIDVLERLVEKSVVTTGLAGDRIRYRLLETIRHYGWTKLIDADEATQARDRHLRYFEGFVERVTPGLFDSHEASADADLTRDHDNIRAAVEWAIETDPDRALHLVGYLYWFWAVAAHAPAGKKLIARALEAGCDGDPDYLAAARTGAAHMAWICPAPDDDMKGDAERAVARYRERSEAPTLHDAWALLLSAEADETTRPEFAELLEEAIEVARAGGWHSIAAYSLGELGTESVLDGDFDAAARLLEEGLDEARLSGAPSVILQALGNHGHMLYDTGRLDEAITEARTAVEIGRHGRNHYFFHYGLVVLNHFLVAAGRNEDANVVIDELVARARATAIERDITRALTEKGWLLCEAGEYDEALRLFQEASDVLERFGFRTDAFLAAAFARHSIGEVKQLRGDIEGAEQIFTEHLKLAQRIDNPAVVAFVAISLAWLEIDRADASASKPYLDIARTSAGKVRALSRHQLHAAITRAEAAIAVQDGDESRALELSRSVADVYEPNDRVPRLARLLHRRLVLDRLSAPATS